MFLKEAALKSPKYSNNTGSQRRHFLQLAGAGLLMPWLPGCGDSTNHSLQLTNTITRGREAILARMEEAPDAVAVSVALLWNDKVVWQEAFGTAPRCQDSCCFPAF